MIALAGVATLLATAPLVAGAGTASAATSGFVPSVFVQTNSADGNSVRAFARADDGSLTSAGTFATGGLGSATLHNPTDPLASQGSLVADRAHGELLAVNAGSDTLTRFSVHGTSLQREQVISTGGQFPVSIAVSGRNVYVLNAGGDGSVSGFRRTGGGLRAIPGSVRPLGLDGSTPPNFLASPAQIGITPDGDRLVVSTKTYGTVDVYAIGANGKPSAAPTVTSTGPVPFPFVFDPAGRIVLGDASGVLSTWSFAADGTLLPVAQAPSNGQVALCWLAEVGGFLYTTNTGSSTVTGYDEAADGTLTLLDADGVTATTDAGPIDLAGTEDGRFLYELNGAAGTAGIYAVGPDGGLTRTGTVTGLPVNSAAAPGMEGIVAT
jgi:6-phosphogluconolactonase (cycloisomerase 2 family)